MARSLLNTRPLFFISGKEGVMSETIPNQDRFLEATETGVMNLKEPVLETAGGGTRLQDYGRRIGRNPVWLIVSAAALGFLVGRSCPAVRPSGTPR
jgi:hypothetical protein